MQTFNTKHGVEVSDEATGVSHIVPPVGSVFMYIGATNPPGFMRCKGQAVLRAQFPDLDAFYAAQGYPFGNGNGTTTFNVPDLRSRFPVGSGTGAGLSPVTFASVGGAASVTIPVACLATHTHTLGGHTHSGSTGNVSADHAHSASFNTSGIQQNHTHLFGHSNHGIAVAADTGSGTTRNSPNSGQSGSYSSATTGGADSGWSSGISANHYHTLFAGDSAGVGFASTTNNDSHTHSFNTGGPSVPNVGQNSTNAAGITILNPNLVIEFIVKY